MSICERCGDEIGVDEQHQAEHPGICCDCFDLSLGMPLEQLNAERVAKGKKPLEGKKRDG